MTCSSQLFDPSVESDFAERNLQYLVKWRNLSTEKTVVRLTSGNEFLDIKKKLYKNETKNTYLQEVMLPVDLKYYSRENMNHLFIRYC